jgi:hypothetical protein
MNDVESAVSQGFEAMLSLFPCTVSYGEETITGTKGFGTISATEMMAAGYDPSEVDAMVSVRASDLQTPIADRDLIMIDGIEYEVKGRILKNSVFQSFYLKKAR